MKLFVDMGNTAIKWCYDSNPINCQSVILPQSPDHQFFASIWSELDGVDVIWLCAVGSQECVRQLQSYAHYYGVAVSQVNTRVQFGLMQNGYHPPESLGVDRWLAAIAAWYAIRQAVIVVDAGTAVTVDAVTAAGVFVGGLILPGQRLCEQALVQGTAGLEIGSDDDNRFPDNTSSAIHRGAWLAVVGGVQAAVRSAESVLGMPCHLMLSGGDGARLQSCLAADVQYAPDLVLQGLRRVVTE